MPGSGDPTARERQLANLKAAPPAPAGNDLALKHGAHSPRVYGPLQEQRFREFVEQFPDEDRTLLLNHARRAAQVQLLEAWIQEHLPTDIKDLRGLKRLLPLLDEQDKRAKAFDRLQLLLERRRTERALAAGVESVPSIEDVVGELLDGPDA